MSDPAPKTTGRPTLPAGRYGTPEWRSAAAFRAAALDNTAYSVVLSDLRARRDALTAAIQTLEEEAPRRAPREPGGGRAINDGYGAAIRT